MRAMELGQRDAKLRVSERSKAVGHQPVSLDDFQVLTKNIE